MTLNDETRGWWAALSFRFTVSLGSDLSRAESSFALRVLKAAAGVATDELPPKVAAAGHDRCVIPIAEKNIDAWLTPEGRSAEELFAILDERDRPYYEHRLAA